MKVEVRKGDLNGALKKLKKKLYNEGVIKEVMDRRFYTKPSVSKRIKRKEAERRERRRQEDQRLAYLGLSRKSKSDKIKERNQKKEKSQ